VDELKGLCLATNGDVSQLSFVGEVPEEGHYYTMEDAATGTGAQNRTFHSLVQEYWRSGQHSYDADSFMVFRNMIKRNLGAGFESFIYADVVDLKPVIHDVKNYDHIPKYIRKDPDMKQMIRGRLKSFSTYTKKERKEVIDRLIAEMDQAGVNSKKYQEIIQGMDRKD